MQTPRLLLVAATSLLLGLAVSLPAEAQQAQTQAQQKKQPQKKQPQKKAAAEPVKEVAPPPPTLPQPSTPTSFALIHTLQNMTTKPLDLVIRADGTQVFAGKLPGRPEKAAEGAEPPTLRTGMTLAVETETTHFWEIVYVEPEAKKQCRQAWTGMFAPGGETPALIAPPQQVNRSGQCDFMIDVTPANEPGSIYDIRVQVAAAPH